MKFGSVRFFKRLIVVAVAALFIVAVVLAIVFGVLYVRQKEQLEQLEIELTTNASNNKAENAQGADGTAESPANDDDDGDPYAHLYVPGPLPPVRPLAEGEKVCYLTFDDGPSPVTQQVLETLAAYDIKATFFVTGKNSEKYADAMRAAAQDGHTIGVHSYTHDYNMIYNSVDDYLLDFDQMYQKVIEVTGDAPTIFRFPGGSINAYNRLDYADFSDEMTRRGFVYFDWNAAGNDAVRGGLSGEEIANNVLRSAAGRDQAIVLLHDNATNTTTAQALPAIIEGMLSQGYRFETLTNTVEPVEFSNIMENNENEM